MRIDLSGHSFVFPENCACCHGVPDQQLTISASRSSGKRIIRTQTNVWDIPYCSGCLDHVRAAESAGNFARVFTVLSLIIGAFVCYSANIAAGALTGVSALATTILVFRAKLLQAHAMRTTECACVGKAIAYLGWHGTLHRFEVASHRFAADLMVANSRKTCKLMARTAPLPVPGRWHNPAFAGLR